MLTGPVLAVGVTVVGVLAVVLRCANRVRRLHRLHIRTDAARDGLDAALRRRTEVAHMIVERERSGAGSPFHDHVRAGALGPAVHAAVGVHGMGAEREAAENALGHRLAELDRTALPPALRAELTDAERLVVLGRHVYHDAVRDTRGLRARRLVRWLRLHGTAPLPSYFEIADPAVVMRAATGPAAACADVGSAVRRTAR
ncbi:NUDIX hydrolase [Pseudonocardia sp.]|uniref:NUDIX hydrolase n=1 Tax=Pseudonocardia sp. TaxID=60912 RepID=UPI00260AB980|nr:NUDIX hydrolase [Pseudonocardia sp.]